MPLTAMDIYKLLPQTNCGDCGSPTCLAFAMQLANKQAALDDCPHASEEAQAELASASEPPIRLVEIGTGDRAVEIGNETVMFRHEETFHHQCGLAVKVADDTGDLAEAVERVNNLWYERIGEEIGVELVFLEANSGDPATFAEAVKTVLDNSDLNLILASDDPEMIGAAFEGVPGLKEASPLIYAANAGNWEAMTEIANENEVPLAVYAEGLEDLAELTQKIAGEGCRDLVLDPGSRDTLEVMNDMTQIRRLALAQGVKEMGYPTLAFADQGDAQDNILQGCTYVCKYAGVVVVDEGEPWQILPLAVLRQNIYTDPRVPPTVDAKVYEVGDVTPDSPVLMTTNFALTYFTVSSEVETSRIPAYIIAIDTEGQSVLTAYASENLNAEDTAKALQQSGLAEKLNHQEIIIPGYVAVMSGELETESGWDVVVGPREATGLPNFLREYASD